MENKLEVRDLRISFRTVSGKVQAVRGINFELKEGETLAIVGESGSGKSVTSKAILGILAGNSIVEGGEILYDKMDLLKIPEDEFYKIRGDKIAMIFQDPLSSLNPIMKIGRQLTEAMLLKGKARQKASRKEFNETLALMKDTMIEALAKNDAAKADEITKMCRNFDKFEFKHIELEQAYNEAFNAATEAIPELENILFLIEKNALTDPKDRLHEVLSLAKNAIHTYVVNEEKDALLSAIASVKSGLGAAVKAKDFSSLSGALAEIKAILERAITLESPNFFSMGYYLTFASEPLPSLSVKELNAFLRRYLDDHFMLDFIDKAKVALKWSADAHYTVKEQVVAQIKEALPLFGSAETSVATLKKTAESLISLVNESIDPCEIVKDSVAYTFGSSLESAVETYKKGLDKNEQEENRYEKQVEKFESFVAKNGREPDWKPAPAAIVDLDLARENMQKILTRLLERYEAALASKETRDYQTETIAVIDYLKASASGVVNHVTRGMARTRAIKLMEEVGIPEPRKRYYQYPFEFSGGMRQRIVIAIALAANPDILICDEPTTALDVTIQAQILELINKLKKERHLSIIFITHDLGVVANMADKIAVMYAGKIVEYGTSNDVFYSPAHPYTWALLSSMPDLDTSEKLEAIPGTTPNMIYPPKGDAFAERNKYALKIDFEEQPPMFTISETHKAATWLLHPDAPKVDPPKIVTERIARMTQRRGENNG